MFGQSLTRPLQVQFGLHNFDVTILTGKGYAEIPHTTNKLRGQFTTELSSNKGLYVGNSMKVGKLYDPVQQVERDMIVVGTLGGMVYVIDPAVDPEGDGALVYELQDDLGWCVMGLDIADVDSWLTGTPYTGDPYNEIVVGTWLDTGNYDDFNTGSDPTRHRGHVIILKPDPASRHLIIKETITLNDSYSPGMFSSGLSGVKVDNVDDDAQHKTEIWCGDATGYLYCLGRNPNAPFNNQYVAFFRSAGMGCYPGIYNKLVPVKKTVTIQGVQRTVTEQLIVFTPGYGYRFQVNYGVVPW
ncbi:MAG: hypothetical protein U1E76_07955 [Planctomycetota bacterium]